MAELAGSGPSRRWDVLIQWGFLVSLALIRAGHLEETDPYWQIRAGAENLMGVPLARPDTWTWSGVAGDWYPNSPLWNVALALSYGAAGFWGFFLLSATTIVLLFVLVDLLARRLGARPLPGLLGLLVVFAAAFPTLNARATLIVQVIVLLAVYLALRLSDRATSVPPVRIAAAVFALALVLSTLGNWVHLSFLLLAPALAAVWAVIWVLTPGLATGRRWALAVSGGLGWVLGTLLSPYGVRTGISRSQAVQEACQGLIAEWSSPFDPNVPRTFLLMLSVALLVAAGTAWLLVRRWRAGARTPDLAALAMIGVPAALAGLVAIRFLAVSLLVLAPVAAAAATRAVDRIRERQAARPSTPVRAKLEEYSSGRFWRIVLTATLVVVSPGVALFAGQHGEPPQRELISRLPSGCRLFARPGLGSAVVLLRPDVPVWMDGRADFFGREMLLRSYEYLGGTAAQAVPEGATCVVVDLSIDANSGLRDRLRAAPAWRLDVAEGNFELWLPAR
jgi:hypothetical protein